MWVYSGIVPTLQPEHFGRLYAAYGGIFVVLSLLWGWQVDRIAPDRYDLIGVRALATFVCTQLRRTSGRSNAFSTRTRYGLHRRSARLLPPARSITAGVCAAAVREIDRILTGYPMRKVAEPVICRGSVTPAHPEACETLGLSLTAGLQLGIFYPYGLGPSFPKASKAHITSGQSGDARIV